MIALVDIENAVERIAPFIHRTPVLSAASIDAIAGAKVFFKCENFQKVGAFKARGAYNTVKLLSVSEKQKGVATHSSGNHAQALALAAKSEGIPAYIVMPENAPAVKKKAVLGYGAKIIECEPTLEAREETLEKVQRDTGAAFVHPYDDERIIAGQATAAKELLEAQPQLDFILTPVGGGGLTAGTALAAHYFSKHTRVVACEPEGADDAFRSFQQGERLPSVKPHTIADGLLTSLGVRNFDIIRKHVTAIHTVSDREIIAAMRLVWERMKIIIEPSSAVPLAVLIRQADVFKGLNIGIIISGGNVDLNKLPF